MLEIFVLLALIRPIERIAEKKGQKPYRWRLIVVGSWFGAEFAGAFIAYMISDSLLGAYVAALGCAVGSYFYIKSKLKRMPDKYDLLSTLGQEVQ